MAQDEDRERRLARQGRIAAIAIALSGLVALLAPWISARLGLTVRHEMLFYLASLGGFVWALAVTVTIWRARRRQ